MSIEWPDIRPDSALARGEFRVISTAVSTPSGPILAAVDAAGCRHLLAKLGGSNIVAEDRNSQGVHLLDRVLEEDGISNRFLDAACRDPRWNALFAVLAEELLAALATDSHIVRSWRTVLVRWRELLNREPPSALSREAAIGLFGELSVLRWILAEQPELIASWRGPLGEAQDFRLGSGALEIKTSTSRDSWNIEINGIGQLDIPAGGWLNLLFLRLEEDPRGENLTEIADATEALAVDKETFRHLLLHIGASREQLEQHSDLRLHQRESAAFTVTSAFPRIVSSYLPDHGVSSRISRVRYQVNLTGLTYHTCIESIQKFLKENKSL